MYYFIIENMTNVYLCEIFDSIPNVDITLLIIYFLKS